MGTVVCAGDLEPDGFFGSICVVGKKC